MYLSTYNLVANHLAYMNFFTFFFNKNGKAVQPRAHAMPLKKLCFDRASEKPMQCHARPDCFERSI